MESEQVGPVDSIKDVVHSSVKVPRVRQTPEEGLRTYQLKCCGNNKNEDNSLKTLNDKNELMLFYIDLFLLLQSKLADENSDGSHIHV